MGAGQSSGRGGGGGGDGDGQAVKTSYYDLLGVARQATEDEIKKAYRRKALELHPDRNYGNEEAATRTFAEVQAAYEVLSDVQERAWYDSHESAILRGDDAGSGYDGDAAAPVYQNVRLTTADDLARMLRKFNSAVEFSDAPSGFYGFLREVFAQLAKEEDAAGMWDDVHVPDYPTFGHKADAYDDVVRRFYAAWSSFSTVKSFAWRDKYKLSEAPDRWYRRRMEQENRAFRKEGVREFNDAVRAFVAFVRKRDPRFIPSTQSEAERQKILRDAATSQAAKARAANQAKLVQEVPAWATERGPEDDEEGISEEEEIVEEILECVVCDKTFKSEKQYEAHERSKKHQKALHALKKRMRKQNAHLDLDGQTSSGVATPDAEDDEEEDDVLGDLAAEVESHDRETNGHIEADVVDGEDEEQDPSRPASPRGAVTEAAVGPATPPLEANNGQHDTEDDSDDEYASAEAVRARLQSTTLDDTPASERGEDTDEPEVASSKPKMGKAAQKRAKKAAAAAASNDSDASASHKCATCGAAFPSRTRLFQHIKDHGHGALKPAGSAGGVKGKKAKGKR